MVGAELVVGYVCGWLGGKARRVGQRADEQVNAALDDVVERLGRRLHDLVLARLHGDPAMEQLVRQARQGPDAISTRTRQRAALALEEATEQDPPFGVALGELVEALRGAGARPASPQTDSGGLTVNGVLGIHAHGGSLAAGLINGGARLENPSVPGPSRS